MGVDTIIQLPANVRVRHVADVIAIAFGCPVTWYRGQGGEWADVPGVSVKPSSVETLSDIAFTSNGRPYHFTYHFEGDSGTRLLLPRAAPEALALGRRLVSFFGGSVTYNDCAGDKPDYTRRYKSDAQNQPSDGQPWARLQQRIYALGPMTNKEIDRMVPLASYPRWTKPEEVALWTHNRKVARLTHEKSAQN